MEITVRSNIKEFERSLTAVQREQVPYATSRALNDTVIDVQNAIVDKIVSVFQNRKKWWLKQQPTGVKVKFSNKQNLKASVTTAAYFAKQQEEGGTKTPKASKHLAIPTDRVPKKYRTSHGAREMIDQRNNVFSTTKGVFRRTGKRTLQVLWTFAASATITPRFQFFATAESVAKRRFPIRFAERLQQALATARR